jgi:sugar transferase (PEP-CTERM/EpsH1 system associated)
MRPPGLRILIVAAELPYPPVGGGPTRTFHLIRELARRHSVSLVTYDEPGASHRVAALKQLCMGVYTVNDPLRSAPAKRRQQLKSITSLASYQRGRAYSPAMQAAISGLLEGQRFDVVQVEFSQMSHFDLGVGPVRVLDEHNIDYELLDRMRQIEGSPIRRLYYAIEAAKVRSEEQGAWDRFDGCVLTSEREQAIVRRHRPNLPTAVVPNGVDLDYFAPAPAESPANLVFSGQIDYRPNTDAVLYFIREVFPEVLRHRPAATFTVVGRRPPDEVSRLAGPSIVITGAVPDVRPYVHQAAVVVAPLRTGSGTRLKLLEAMAMGKAIVTTSVGCEGLAVQPGEHLLVADAPTAMAQAIVRLIDDTALRRHLGERGRALVERQYGWAAVVPPLERLLAELVLNKHGHATLPAQASAIG